MAIDSGMSTKPRFATLAMTFLLTACAGRSTTTAPTSMPVTWFSIPANDIAAAGRFYTQAFGWKIEPLTREADGTFDFHVAVSSPSNNDYEPSRAGRVNGCIVKRETGISTPVVLIEVDDLDAAMKKVIAAGGTVASAKIPMRSLGGEFVLVRDPDGNMLELFHSNR